MNDGLQKIVGDLRKDPHALETVWVSVIAFAERRIYLPERLSRYMTLCLLSPAFLSVEELTSRLPYGTTTQIDSQVRKRRRKKR